MSSASKVLLPRKSAEIISKLAKDVKISTDGIKKVSDVIERGIKEEKYSIKNWKIEELHPKIADENAINWIFLVDTLNFSFWTEKTDSYYISYKNKKYSGYWSLCAAINRALEEGIPITSPNYYAKMNLNEFKYIFRTDSNVEIPLIEQRHKITNETGNILLEKFNGSFLNVVTLGKNNAECLLNIIIENFQSYKDEAQIDNYKVSLYKRAQILIADIWSCYEGQSYGKFDDIDFITMFADYRVPQVLVYFGVLEYSTNLLQHLENGLLLINGERFEVEIRGCTIHAIELICKCLKEKLQKEELGNQLQVNSIIIDYYLWNYRQKYAQELKSVPFHKTRCIYY